MRRLIQLSSETPAALQSGQQVLGCASHACRWGFVVSSLSGRAGITNSSMHSYNMQELFCISPTIVTQRTQWYAGCVDRVVLALFDNQGSQT